MTAKQVADASDPHAVGMAGVHAFTKLQVLLHENGEIPYITLLPLAKLGGLADLLRKHVASLAARISRVKQPTPPATTSFELLQLCTADPPMSQQHAYVLSDLFPRIRNLAVACTAESSQEEANAPSTDSAGDSSMACGVEGGAGSGLTGDKWKLRDLRELLDEQVYRDTVDFWSAEWTVD